MMSRLIDDMSLKDRVSEYTLSSDEYERFCRIIDAEPTAYNVDNVLNQLEEEKSFHMRILTSMWMKYVLAWIQNMMTCTTEDWIEQSR